MKRYPPFPVPFGSGHLCAAKATGAGDSDTFCTELKGRSYAFLHGTAKSNSPLKLEGNVLGNQLRIKLRLTDFLDIEIYFLIGKFGQFLLKGFDLGTLSCR